MELERSGAAGTFGARAKLLKGLVGAWGFEPQTPTVSSSALGRVTLFKSTSTSFAQQELHCMLCIHCFKCSFSTFLCAKLCAHFIALLDSFAKQISKLNHLRGSGPSHHTSDCGPAFGEQVRPTTLPCPTLPTPIQTKSFSVPRNYCLRFDYDQRRAPLLPNT